MPITAPHASRGHGVVVEPLEARTLFAAYLINTDADLAYVNSLNLVAGDQVLLRGGQTFNGALEFNNLDRGKPLKPVIVTSYDPNTGLPIAAGAGAAERATLNSADNAGIWIQNTAGIDISGLNIVGNGRTNNSATGVYASNGLPGNRKLTRLYFNDLDVSGYGGHGILIEGKTGKSGFSNVRITNSALHDNGQSGMTIYGQFKRNSLGYAHRKVYVGHVNAYQNSGVAGYGQHSGSGIVVGDTNGALIEYSTASYNGWLNTAVGGPVGIWAYDANRVVIQYNESHHNQTNSTADGGGFDLDGGVTNSVMQHNYSHDNDGSGYGLYQYAGARPWRNNVVQFNVSENDGRKNGYGAIDLWSAGSKMLKASIHDNTVIVDSVGATAMPWAVRLSTALLVNIKLFNNALTANNNAGLIWSESFLSPSAVRFQNNTYAADLFHIAWGGSSYSSLDDWQTLTRQETLPDGRRVGSVKPTSSVTSVTV